MRNRPYQVLKCSRYACGLARPVSGQGMLGSWCSPSTCSLPGYVQTLLVAIWASSAACFFELTTDAPLWSSLIPVILILAPGAGAVKAVLGSFHRSEGDGESSTYTLWESLVLEGATYAAGFLIAMEFWLPLLAIKHDVHSCSRGHRGKLGRKSEWISNIIGYQRSVAVQASFGTCTLGLAASRVKNVFAATHKKYVGLVATALPS